VVAGIDEFLRDYPQMLTQPLSDSDLVLQGVFRFSANYREAPTITDDYRLRIVVSEKFPIDLPTVTELDRKIPRDRKHHVNATDNTLCLGSPLRLALALTKDPTLTGFASLCLVPFLYAMSHKRLYGGQFLFSELKHGIAGILDDYAELFRVRTRQAAEATLVLLGMKKERPTSGRAHAAAAKGLANANLITRFANGEKLRGDPGFDSSWRTFAKTRPASPPTKSLRSQTPFR
jgi:hypothetical protein